jgi:hypothetical protein
VRLLKTSLKKILFIIICAELMIFYWAYLESQKTEQVVYRHKDQQPPNTTPSADKAAVTLKKAS